MNLLLDTHVFIWSQTAVAKISAPKIRALRNTQNVLFLSLANVWEIQIKIQIGKFSFPKPLSDIIKEQQAVNDLQILPITAEHIYALDNLPFHHKDPFDRMLIAQATVENYTLVTDDAHFSAYTVNLI
jgi:PIN domain nuclease of toxin-antitoxin system